MIINKTIPQNMHRNIASLVRMILKNMDAPANKIQEFDASLKIKIDLSDDLSMDLYVDEDRLYLKTALRCNENQLISNGEAILSAISEPIQGVETGHFALGKCDKGYELKALLSLDYAVQEDGLPSVINAFSRCAEIINFSCSHPKYEKLASRNPHYIFLK